MAFDAAMLRTMTGYFITQNQAPKPIDLIHFRGAPLSAGGSFKVGDITVTRLPALPHRATYPFKAEKFGVTLTAELAEDELLKYVNPHEALIEFLDGLTEAMDEEIAKLADLAAHNGDFFDG